ncbi:FAD-binding oxidoreductase [Egicoccus sp. AB-alg2]|uniref:FAD-binding oxidoreductase n=1 Tax=Egicoccus sp. AB-alg2 TaxID=3242693 RepID=UPI00359EF9CD
MTFLEQLAEALPDGALVTDPDIVEGYRYDRTDWVQPGQPVGVAFATTTEHVAAAVKVAAAHRVPIVPRGAGSSLCGGASAIDGALVLCLERMDRILDIDPVDQMAVVEPGVINADLSTAVGDQGLFYPPDPASQTFCSIGGNVATNAGGLCCVKYGVTRDYVLGLEVVLADGTVIETGRRTIKGVAGYDLTQLLVGSEGTLGIVTRVRVRLRPAPSGASTMVAFFPTAAAAGDAVAAIARSGLQLSLLEIMDRATVGVVDDWKHMGLDRDAAALLLAQSDSPEPLRAEEVERAATLCDQAGASYTAFTSDPAEAEALLQARRLAGPAIERLGEAIWDDVGVPRSRVPELIARIEEVAERREVRVFTFGHAGDGNLHPLFSVPRGDEDARARTLEAFDEVVEIALELGGTITGEHGVGRIKRKFLAAEVGTANLEVQRTIKRALDPAGILNPGRAL